MMWPTQFAHGFAWVISDAVPRLSIPAVLLVNIHLVRFLSASSSYPAVVAQLLPGLKSGKGAGSMSLPFEQNQKL